MQKVQFDVNTLIVLLEKMNLSADACEFVFKVLDIAQEGHIVLSDENIASLLPSWDSARVESALEELRWIDLVGFPPHLMDLPSDINMEFFSIDDLTVEYKTMLLLDELGADEYFQSLTEREQRDVEIILYKWVKDSYFNDDCWNMLAAPSRSTIDAIRVNLETYSTQDLRLAIHNYSGVLYYDRYNVVPAMDLLEFLTLEDDYGLLAWKWFLLMNETYD